ncbi:MAG: hypothetical protein ACLUXK_13480 [[Ruminococcus] torques]|jgi:hypothetical protein|nr:MAG TPA: hypothetical protein [Caudoviricetes sp.]
MKIFLLIMLILLFLKRIKDTPKALSYRVWEDKLVKSLKESDDIIKELKLKSIKEFGTTIVCDIVFVISYIFIIILYVLFITTYSLVGTKLESTYLLIMSAIQIILTLYGMKISFGKELYSTKFEDYKFRRTYNLLNVIVDYMYYPVAIWMLL